MSGRRFSRLLAILFASAPLLSPMAQAAPARSDLRVNVALASDDTDGGKIVCDLYNAPDGFPTAPAKAVAHAEAVVAHHRGTCVFKNVAAGSYAVGAFHDKDSDGKLRLNLIGMPNEPVGVSNDARGFMGPPSFEAARFDFSGRPAEIAIHLG